MHVELHCFALYCIALQKLQKNCIAKVADAKDLNYELRLEGKR